jgi:hypothetical protein
MISGPKAVDFTIAVAENHMGSCFKHTFSSLCRSAVAGVLSLW